MEKREDATIDGDAYENTRKLTLAGDGHRGDDVWSTLHTAAV